MATPTFILPSAPTYTEGFVNGLNVYPNPTNFVANQVPFTRATTATRTNAAGLIELVPYNLVQYSEMFSQAAWVKPSATITANIETAPNGTLTADKIVSNASNGFMYQTFAAVANSTYTFSCYVKTSNIATTLDIALLNASGASGIANVSFTTTNNWTRVSVTGLSLTTQSAWVAIGTGGSFSTNEELFIWGAQLVEGTSALPYQLTETRLNRPRVDFSLGGCPSLLLEPQRTNLSLFSEQFDNAWWLKTASITANSTISPSGIQNADTFTDSSAVSYLDVRTSAITITANATYTASFFIKKTTGALTNYAGVGFILTGTVQRTDFGIINTTTGQVVRDAASSINVATYSSQSYNDYWRVIVTFTDNQSNTNCSMYLYPAISTNGTSISPTAQGSNVFWGAQFELGAYPTTYVPTTAATVTRNSDTFQLSNVFTNNLISSAGGTWFMELRNNLGLSRDAFSSGLYLSDAGFLISFLLRNDGGPNSRLRLQKRVGGVETPLLTTSTDTCRIAIKWNGSTADVFENGIKVVSATSFTGTAMENLVGLAGDVPKIINSMALWNIPLTDDELEVITGTAFNTYALMASNYNYILQ